MRPNALKYGFALIVASLLLLWQQANASHITGGDISYVCNGNGTFDVTLNLFRDCDGIAVGTTQDITVQSSCGVNTTITVQLVAVGGVEISQLCQNQLPQSSCNGGTLPGNEIYTYVATAPLPYCNGTYTFSWTDCCRNALATNINGPGGADLYVETVYNMANDPCDSSPYFENNPTAFPLQYVCLGAPYSYNFGVVDPDADALSYTLIAAQTGPGAAIGYVSPWSATQPITGIVIDPVTGQLDFTPNTQGNFVVTVQCDSYDANGNWLGHVIRDIQFVVFPCANQQMPVMANGGINTFSGSANLTGPTAIDMCTGDDFCFSLEITDGNVNQTLSVTSNVAQALPGATMIVTGTNPINVDVCYTANQLSPDFAAFTLVIADDNCPIPGVITFTVAVTVTDRTFAGPDQTICNGASAPLQAYNGNVFTWSVISGDTTMNDPTVFSCNPCDDPVASPSVTTEYLVTSDFTAGCGNTDTVVVVVPGDITMDKILSADTVCLNEQVQIEIVPDPPGSYSYAWDPDPQLNTNIGTNVLATMVTPGMNRFPVSLTNPLGCNAWDTVEVFVTPSTIPPLTFGGITTICEGDSTTISADFVTAPECVHVLELIDLFGNGWSNGSVEVWVDGALEGSYSATGFGNEIWLTLPVNASIELIYNPDMFNTQVDFLLYDGSGNLMFDCPDNPPGGSLFTGTVTCGAFSYDWSPTNTALVNSTGNEITVWGNTSTTYTVVVENAEQTCRDSAAVLVDIATAPIITNIFVEDEQCVSGNNGILNVAVSGGTAPFEYSIDGGTNTQNVGIIDSLTAGTYEVLVSDANACTVTSNPTVIGPYSPPFAFCGTAAPVCLGAATQLTANAGGGIPGAQYTYSWYTEPIPGSYATVAQGSSANYTPSQNEVVYMVADDGCNDSVAVCSTQVAVYQWPITDFSIGDSVGCAPQQVEFSYQAANPGDSVIWHFSSGDTVVANGDFAYEFENPGVWDVFVEAYSEGGCGTFNNYEDIISVYAVPEAYFYYTPKDPTISKSLVHFTNESSGVLDSWEWDFAGLASSMENNPSFEFPADTGYYPVNLSVVSTDGCTHDTTLLVYINGEFFFHMPDAFTPNYDGRNDVFVPIGYGLESSRSAFFLYNRWGELIHQTSSPYDGWDGMYKGNPAPTGVYIWKMVAPDPFARDPNQTREWTGHVTLIR